MHNRSTLHVNKLDEFKAFCESKGWVSEPLKGDYEVLRMRHKEQKYPLILFSRIGAQHLTVFGIGMKMTRTFLHERKHFLENS